MRRWIVSGMVAAMLAGGGGVFVAAHGSPGPNGNNNYGLCNAYSNGSPTGQANKAAHGQAFIALEATATAWDAANDMQNEPTENDSQESTQQKVAEYCAANGQHP